MNSPARTAAIYARVSSETHSADSQVQALKARVQADGLTLEAEFSFLDDGYSGASLMRPALERLRDQASIGTIDRLYIQSHVRLARKQAHRDLLIEEFRRAGVEVVFSEPQS